MMKYSVRVHTGGSLYDVLISLAKVLHADEIEDGDDEKPTNTTPDDAEKKRLASIYETKAANMAVVDMRDGFILKIAPVSCLYCSTSFLIQFGISFHTLVVERLALGRLAK